MVTLERNIQREADRTLPSLHEKIAELRRHIEQLDRRLRDRSEIVEVRTRILQGHLFKHLTFVLESMKESCRIDLSSRLM